MVDAINRTDMDLRKALFGNIVMSGGSTLTKGSHHATWASVGWGLLTLTTGFGDRLLSEVRRLAVKDMKIKIFAPPERKYSTWIGGSILAGLSTFRKVRPIRFVGFFFHFIFFFPPVSPPLLSLFLFWASTFLSSTSSRTRVVRKIA